MKFPTFQSEDEIPEAFREVYEQQDDGTWAVPDPDPSGDDGGVDVDKLQDALAAERKRADAAERATQKASAELAQLKTGQKAADEGITQEKLESIRADVREELEREYGPKIESADEALAENRRLKLDNRVKNLAAKHGVRGERLDAWWRQHQHRFDLGDDGEPIVKDHPGKKVTHFITHDLKDEIPEFYEGSKGDGGGAPGAGGAGTGGGSALSFEDIVKNPARGIEEANKATTTVAE